MGDNTSCCTASVDLQSRYDGMAAGGLILAYFFSVIEAILCENVL